MFEAVHNSHYLGHFDPIGKLEIQKKIEKVNKLKMITEEEFEEMSNKENCLVIVKNKVYDWSKVGKWHPGGSGQI